MRSIIGSGSGGTAIGACGSIIGADTGGGASFGVSVLVATDIALPHPPQNRISGVIAAPHAVQNLDKLYLPKSILKSDKRNKIQLKAFGCAGA
jgi:hypothetical protein